MKKLFILVLILAVCLSLCACTNDITPENAEDHTTLAITEPDVVFPEVQMIINSNKENTTTELRVFPSTKYSDLRTAYAHYYVTSENPTEIIRIKLEEQWGREEKTEGDFEIESDELVEVETNKWLTFPFSISASNLYFYRLTMYYGEHEEVLATKTIYTPYEKPFYNESSFGDAAPKFHPINGLLDNEQVFFDNCQYAVVDYAKINHYSNVVSIIGWQAENYLYLCVEYGSAGGYESIWFAIKNDNPEAYVAHIDYEGIIPDDEGTAEQNVLFDYFYVVKALNNAIAN